MGYLRKSLQLLSGGYNANAPVDKVPGVEMLLAQNWRSDSSGQLISRAGYPSKFSITGAGIAHSAANTGGAASPYYVGCNSGITNPTSKLYYNGNSTAIATGFDGKRIAFAAQNDFMWIMNRAVQGRHNANVGFQPWNILPPPASPTVAAGSSPSPVTNVTFSYGFQGTTVAASIAVGSQTVTPASMTGITVGVNLGVSNAAFSNYEVVTVTAITGSTFTAVFTSTKTGPGILVGFSDYVHFLTIAGITYSFSQNGYSNAQIPLVIASLASSDPNCSVTFSGTGNNVVIAAVTPNTLLPVSGSDGNANTNLAIGGVTSLPNGTYQFYLTFLSADLSIESNPGPVSAAVSVVSQPIAVTIPAADAPTDARVGSINIYATGGTLASPYLVGNVASTVASPATTFLDTIPDLQATANGVVMPTQNDPAPKASGMIGPQWGRLYAWSTVANPNRLFYTNANIPQYWPGSADPQVGNWVDVGLDDEAIVWCSIHTNLLIIYKERSIWMLIGDPATGTLEQVYDGIGLAGQWALTPAGQIDYFVGPNGLYLFDMSEVHEISGDVLPLFNQSLTNAGSLTPPGSVLPGSAFNSTSTAVYAIALGHALGRLYIAYAEQGSSNWNLLVQDEGPEPETQAFISRRPGRWFYHRNIVANTLGFFGFFFDGNAMIGLTGAASEPAVGLNVSDFRGFLTADAGPVAIECVYQSHYEDCGLPDNDKQYLEVAIDFQAAAGLTGGTASVYAGFNNGNVAPALIGTMPVATRGTVSFPLGALPGAGDGGYQARNISVLVYLQSTGQSILYNVYIYYYEEARLAVVASTIPSDLGVGKIKECKELQLDINAYGNVGVAIQSDLPGNVLATRQTPTVATSTGRGIVKYPFAITLGLLWQVTLAGGPFRLYGARLLMRVIGVFVEGYESTAGFLWDSMQLALGDGEVSTLDTLRFEMQAGGASSVHLFTDLPGEASTSQGTYTLTSGGTTRSWVTVPLPSGIEGRSLQVQVTGNSGFRIYKAQVRHGHVGRYLAGTAPDAALDAFRTLEFDFSSERRKVFKRIEVDLNANSTVGMSIFTDQDGAALSAVTGATMTTSGRQIVLVPMPPGIRGRLLRVSLSSASAARIYRIRVLTRTVGDPKAGWEWEEFPLESSDVVPTWMDLISVEETSPIWTLVDIPFEVTE